MSKHRNREMPPMVEVPPLASSPSPEVSLLPPPMAPPQPPRQLAEKNTWRFQLRPPWPMAVITIEGISGDEAAAKAELLKQLEAAIVVASPSVPPAIRELEAVEDGLARFSDDETLSLPETAVVEPKVLVLDKESNDEIMIDANGQKPTAWRITIPRQKRVVAWRKGFGWTRVRQEIEMLRCDLERANRKLKPKLFPHEEMAFGGLQ